MKKIHLIGLSLLTALLLSAAWPARGFVPLIFVAFVPLLFIQDYLGNERKKGVFALAYLSFFIWNILTTWWIWNSTEIGAIAALGLNSLFMTTVFWLFHFTKVHLYENRKGFLILIFYWLTWEWFHLDWDLSWPWLNLGHVFSTKHQWIQWYEYTGVAGGTAWILLVNILIFQLIKKIIQDRKPSRKFGLQLAGVFLVVLIPVLISGYIYRNYTEDGPTADIIVVQPDFDPYTEQYELPPSAIIDRNLELAMRAMTSNADFVVSPESAIQEEIWEEQLDRSSGLAQLNEFIGQHPETAIVIGASTFSMVPKGQEKHHAARKFRTIDGYYYAYNTAFYLDSSPKLQLYHKSKLTPGVEMMPSWKILRPLNNFAIDLGGTVGTLKVDEERKVFVHKDGLFKVAPVICYESVYGEFVNQYVLNGANLIFIITNDGWWGNTPGHRQHLEFAKLRAIETRRSIARSANTGISAFFDQRGDIYQATPYREPAVIRQKLSTNEKLTFYVKFGDYLARISGFISVIFLLTGFTRRILKKRKTL
ncbi:MAG: apolipoprotein N-acyltransferase [Bacteroidales bacterium]|nr:apolipoprotein N-acyltransferase [Bacteroidales bacterium]